MSKKMRKLVFANKYLLSLLLVVLVGAPQVVKAGKVLTNPLSTGGGAEATQSFPLAAVVGQALKVLLGVSGSLSMLFIVIGGARIVFAAGKEDQVTKGKQTLFFAIIGLLVSFLGFFVVDQIAEVIEYIKDID